MAIETAVFGAEAWAVATMRSELVSSHTHYVVALDGPSVVAYAGLLAPTGAADADIQTIAVVPTARRRGIGRTLMLHLMDAAAHRGAATVFLEVRADNVDAQRLYAALGFVTIATRTAYYQPDGVDALVMRAELAPHPAVGPVGSEAVGEQ